MANAFICRAPPARRRPPLRAARRARRYRRISIVPVQWLSPQRAMRLALIPASPRSREPRRTVPLKTPSLWCFRHVVLAGYSQMRTKRRLLQDPAPPCAPGTRLRCGTVGSSCGRYLAKVNSARPFAIPVLGNGAIVSVPSAPPSRSVTRPVARAGSCGGSRAASASCPPTRLITASCVGREQQLSPTELLLQRVQPRRKDVSDNVCGTSKQDGCQSVRFGPRAMARASIGGRSRRTVTELFTSLGKLGRIAGRSQSSSTPSPAQRPDSPRRQVESRTWVLRPWASCKRSSTHLGSWLRGVVKTMQNGIRSCSQTVASFDDNARSIWAEDLIWKQKSTRTPIGHQAQCDWDFW